MDRDPRARLHIVMGKEGAGKFLGTIGILAVHSQPFVEARREEECRLGRGGADAPEPASERAAQIENAEMEPRRRLDEDRRKLFGRGHGAAGSERADRM